MANIKTYGVDVSGYQLDTLAFFQQLKNTGATFAIVKITEGLGYVNPNATNQVINADKVGMDTAGYHFARFGGNVALAKQEAAFFINQASARLAKGSILALDYEDDASGDVNANTAAMIAFMDAVKAAGFIPWSYSYKPYYDEHTNLGAIVQKYPNSTWVAGYPLSNTPDFNHFPSVEGVSVWQYSNNWQGLGVDGNVLLLDWPEYKHGNEGEKTMAKPTAAVWDKNGKWYTDKQFKKLANGMIKHMDSYYYFENGKRIDNAFRFEYDFMYYLGKDGKAVQGVQKIGNKSYDFGTDGTYYLRGVK